MRHPRPLWYVTSPHMQSEGGVVRGIDTPAPALEVWVM